MRDAQYDSVRCLRLTTGRYIRRFLRPALARDRNRRWASFVFYRIRLPQACQHVVITLRHIRWGFTCWHVDDIHFRGNADALPGGKDGGMDAMDVLLAGEPGGRIHHAISA